MSLLIYNSHTVQYVCHSMVFSNSDLCNRHHIQNIRTCPSPQKKPTASQQSLPISLQLSGSVDLSVLTALLFMLQLFSRAFLFNDWLRRAVPASPGNGRSGQGLSWTRARCPFSGLKSPGSLPLGTRIFLNSREKSSTFFPLPGASRVWVHLESCFISGKLGNRLSPQHFWPCCLGEGSRIN